MNNYNYDVKLIHSSLVFADEIFAVGSGEIVPEEGACFAEEGHPAFQLQVVLLIATVGLMVAPVVESELFAARGPQPLAFFVPVGTGSPPVLVVVA